VFYTMDKIKDCKGCKKEFFSKELKYLKMPKNWGGIQLGEKKYDLCVVCLNKFQRILGDTIQEGSKDDFQKQV